MARGRTPPALPWWQHLEALRQDEGWSRTQLAQKAGVARTTVDAWKTNPRQPLVTTITEVADRLEIDRQEALRLAGITPPASPADSGGEEAVDRLERLWREYKDDPGERGVVLRELLTTWDEADGQSETDRRSETG